MARISDPLRIGMFGFRGLQPDLEITGFETAFAEIAPRLARRGHEITMYCRASAHSASNRAPHARGVNLIYVPSPGGKNFAAVISTFLAVVHALVFRRFDVWFFVNVGMGHHCALARLSGRPVIMNVDGLDWTRRKWGPLARAYFLSAASSAVRVCTRLVTDAHAMRAYYLEHFGTDSVMISYGADIEDSVAPELLAPFGVAPRDYYLIVSRLIPENSVIEMMEGFIESTTARHLVVVGGSTYASPFQERLHDIAARDARIIMAGHVGDQAALRELWCNCFAYLHGHSVGGTNPALLRAMGHGSAVLALDTVFNREVLAGAAHFFVAEKHQIAASINAVDDGLELPALRIAARNRACSEYTWEGVTAQYDALFRAVSAQ